MAKKRKAKTRVVTRTRTIKAKTRRAKSSGGITPMKAVTGGLIYGAVRGKVASVIQPFTKNIPAGNYADEAGMLLLSYLAYKKVKMIPKQVSLAGMMIESAVIGNDIGSGALMNNIGAGSVASTRGGYPV